MAESARSLGTVWANPAEAAGPRSILRGPAGADAKDGATCGVSAASGSDRFRVVRATQPEIRTRPRFARPVHRWHSGICRQMRKGPDALRGAPHRGSVPAVRRLESAARSGLSGRMRPNARQPAKPSDHRLNTLPDATARSATASRAHPSSSAQLPSQSQRKPRRSRLPCP